MKNKIYVTRSSLPECEEYFNEIKDIWDSHILTNMGIKHNKLESKLKEYLEVPEISLMCNGHMALELGLQALKLSGEVITTPFTFASTTHAIVRNRLEPVFCDINPIDYTIDTTKIEKLITDKTSAILPVHVYGNICNIEEIDYIAKKYGLKIIYDAAHAFGIQYKRKGIGNFGDATMFSFHATKVFNTIEGGAVCFKDKDYGLDLYRLKNFGIRSEDCVDFVGSNAKMNEFQAAMGLCNLKYIDCNIQKRKMVYEQYKDLLQNIDGLTISKPLDNVTSNYAYLPILIDEKKFGSTRNEVYNSLILNNIYPRKYFYPLTNSYDCYHNKYKIEDTPVALYISKRILTLPIYPELLSNDIFRICKIIMDLKK